MLKLWKLGAVMAFTVVIVAAGGFAIYNFLLQDNSAEPVNFVPTLNPRPTPVFSPAAQQQPGSVSGPTAMPTTGPATTPMATYDPASGPTASPMQGPDATPVSGTSPVPTVTPPGDTPDGQYTDSGSLFDLMHVNWFVYDATVDDDSLTVRCDYISGIIDGMQALDERITITKGPRVYVFDSYLDPDNYDDLGGHVRITTNGAVTMDEDVASVEFERYLDETTGAYLMVADEYVYGHWPLIPQGTETLTLGGIAYNCTKYMVGGNADQGYAWVSQYVPVPLKIVRDTWEGNVTVRLTGWG